MKKNTSGFALWLARELKDWSTYVLFALLCIIISLPVWAGYLLGIFFEQSWALNIATAIIGAGLPLIIPFFPACAILTLLLKLVLGKSIKRLFNFAIKKLVEFIGWIWHECKDIRTFILLVIVCLVIGAPVWVGYLLYFITGWGWTLAVATALLAFWWLPGAPYFAVCVAVTLAIKRFFEKKVEKSKVLDNAENESVADSLNDKNK